jgi:hypothetical protein
MADALRGTNKPLMARALNAWTKAIRNLHTPAKGGKMSDFFIGSKSRQTEYTLQLATLGYFESQKQFEDAVAHEISHYTKINRSWSRKLSTHGLKVADMKVLEEVSNSDTD